ncbi:hypothetical protein OHS33_17740 [Streptomyces sp. NBC_00536]|uniref:hypothetical protein n=1 Tax=Streptomyces sp. NBC_00536 TaxID=2975769 RepID=UPI002E80F197|nr:hypothetical protein [Streptomyces sp. NBC_00536]WUC80025.1 hypothetical protein OHS33_17740 [Streptomyces sp. NBC_00536]
MSDHDSDDAARECMIRLREALAEHGITLPSLGLDLPTFASIYLTPPLISLGNCNVKTAAQLTAVLRTAAATTAR